MKAIRGVVSLRYEHGDESTLGWDLLPVWEHLTSCLAFRGAVAMVLVVVRPSQIEEVLFGYEDSN
jgi:hypothetical protein